MGAHNATPAERNYYWRDLAERAVRAFAQGMLATLGVGSATFAEGGLAWADSALIGVGSAVISVLLSLAGGKFGDKSTPSFQHAPPPEVVPPPFSPPSASLNPPPAPPTV